MNKKLQQKARIAIKNTFIFLLISLMVLTSCTNDVEVNSPKQSNEELITFQDNNIYVHQEQVGKVTPEIILRGKAGEAEWRLKAINSDFDASAITVVDALDNDIPFDADKRRIKLDENTLIPGMPYTIALPEGIIFDNPNYMMARKITYIVEREEKEVVEYNSNVREIQSEKVTMNENILIFDSDTGVIEGEVIIVPTPTEDKPHDSTAYKISNVSASENGGIEATTVDATIEDVFSKLDIYGEYEANPDNLIIDEEALESQIRESGLLDLLIPTAHAATYDPSNIKLKFKTDKSNSGGLIFDIEISMEKMGGRENTLVVDIILELKTNVFVDVVNKMVFDVYVQNINSMSITAKSKGPDGKTLEDWTDELYDNDNKYLRELEDRIYDEGDKVLRLGSIPIPIAGPVNVNVDIDFFFSFTGKGGLTLGNNYTTTTTSGVIISKKGVKPYSTKKQEGGVDKVSFCLYGEMKAGAKISVTLEACRVLFVGLELEGGFYGELGGIVTYSKEKEWEGNGGFELGVYYELSFIAELNYFIDKIDYEHALADKQYPIIDLKLFKYELLCDASIVNLNELGYISIPDIKMQEDSAFTEEGTTISDVKLEQLEFSFDNLSYDIEDDLDFIIISDSNFIFINPKNIDELDDTTLTVRMKDDPDIKLEFEVVNSIANGEPRNDQDINEYVPPVLVSVSEWEIHIESSSYNRIRLYKDSKLIGEDYKFVLDSYEFTIEPHDLYFEIIDYEGNIVGTQEINKVMYLDGAGDNSMLYLFDQYSDIESLLIDYHGNFSYLDILSNYTNLKYLALTDLGGTDLSNVLIPNTVETLIAVVPESNNLFSLEDSSNLKSLAIIGDNVNDLASISILKELTYLALICDADDLSAISKLSKLKFLYLSANATDISPIGQLHSLESFEYWGDFDDISALASLMKLEYLEIGGDFNDISSVSGLTNLRYLELYGEYVDISPIKSLVNLEILSLSGKFTDISVLAYLKNLEEAYISGDADAAFDTSILDDMGVEYEVWP